LKQKTYEGRSAFDFSRQASSYHRSIGKILIRNYGANNLKQEVPFAGQFIDWLLTTNDGIRIAIEVHGEHHYRTVDYGGSNPWKSLERYENRKFLDRKKRTALLKDGISYVEIPFQKAEDEKWVVEKIDQAIKEARE